MNLQKLNKLMKFYGLTIGDLPAFPKQDLDLKKLIITLGEAKQKYVRSNPLSKTTA